MAHPYTLQAEERSLQPAAYEAAAHRIGGAVDDLEETAVQRSVLHRRDDFEVPLGLQVQHHELPILRLCNPGDILKPALPGFLEVLENDTRRNPSGTIALDAEAFERMGSELPREDLSGMLLTKHPVIKAGEENPRAPFQQGFHIPFFRLRHQQFRGMERADEVTERLREDGGNPELRRRHVDISNTRKLTTAVLQESGGTEVIVAAVIKNAVAVSNAGGYDIGDFASNNTLGHGGILDLIADRHLEALADKLGYVAFAGMMGKTRHRNVGGSTVRTAGQDDVDR